MCLLIISLRETLVGITNFCGSVYARVFSEVQQYVASLQTVRPLSCFKIVAHTHMIPSRCLIVEILCSLFTIQYNFPRSKMDQGVIENRNCHFSHAVRKDISLSEFQNSFV